MNCRIWGSSGHVYRAYDGPGSELRCKCGEPEPGGSQGTLDFDSTASRRARDAGMAAADAGVSDEWKSAADSAIESVARLQYEFIVDEVWRVLDAWELDRPREGRAMGPRMTAAQRRGIIEPTDRLRQTEQVKSHGQPRRIWRSRIHNREETR